MEIKFSRQREAIKENLMGRVDHPTAEMVYDSVRVEYPRISLGTVYRNLSQMAEAGVIQRIAMNDGADRFDWNEIPHYHFKCRKCGSVIDLKMSDNALELILSAVEEELPEVTGYQLVLVGICRDCKNKLKF